MKQVEKYFKGERKESVLFMLVGVVVIGLAVYFITMQEQIFYQGMAYPFIVIGLIQIIVGGWVYIRSPKDLERVKNVIEQKDNELLTEEITRMEEVMKNFVNYRWIEIILLGAGIFMFIYFENFILIEGIGLGLIIQSSLMLLLDYLAEKRGKIYLEYLRGM